MGSVLRALIFGNSHVPRTLLYMNTIYQKCYIIYHIHTLFGSLMFLEAPSFFGSPSQGLQAASTQSLPQIGKEGGKEASGAATVLRGAESRFWNIRGGGPR